MFGVLHQSNRGGACRGRLESGGIRGNGAGILPAQRGKSGCQADGEQHLSHGYLLKSFQTA
jgi:hypothetical protein